MKENSIDFEKVVFNVEFFESLYMILHESHDYSEFAELERMYEDELLESAREFLSSRISEIYQTLSIGDFLQAKELHRNGDTFCLYNNIIRTRRNTSKSLVKGIIDLKSIQNQQEFIERHKHYCEWMTMVINRKEDSNSLFDGVFYRKINQEFQKLELKMHLPAFIDYAHKELLLYVEEWIAFVDQSLAYTEEHWDVLLESV